MKTYTHEPKFRLEPYAKDMAVTHPLKLWPGRHWGFPNRHLKHAPWWFKPSKLN